MGRGEPLKVFFIPIKGRDQKMGLGIGRNGKEVEEKHGVCEGNKVLKGSAIIIHIRQK